MATLPFEDDENCCSRFGTHRSQGELRSQSILAGAWSSVAAGVAALETSSDLLFASGVPWWQLAIWPGPVKYNNITVKLLVKKWAASPLSSWSTRKPPATGIGFAT